jgi:hypothetical protein
MCMCMCVYKSGNKIRSCIFGSPSVCFDCVRREQRKKRALKQSFLTVKFEVVRLSIFSSGWIVVRKVEGKGEDRAKGRQDVLCSGV